MRDKTLFDQVGGIATLRRVNKLFYEKVYAHPWLKKYFANVEQDQIASQQSEFMQGVLGGPKIYRGRTPGTAHPHIEITEKAFNMRQEMLRQALEETRIDPEIARRWLALDEAFRQRLIQGLDQCTKRYGTDQIVRAPPGAK